MKLVVTVGSTVVTSLKEALHSVAGGVLVGTVIGVAEGLFLLVRRGAPDLLAPLYGGVLYGLIGLVLGGMVGMALSAVPDDRRPAGLGWGIAAAVTFTVLSAGMLGLHEVRAILEGAMRLEAAPGVQFLFLASANGLLLALGPAVFAEHSERVGGAMLAVLVLLTLSGLLRIRDSYRDVMQVPVSLPISGKEEGQIPNTLFIVMGALRSDVVGEKSTPYIHALAKDGVTFQQAISASAATGPAMVSLLTGLEPSHHKVLGAADVLRPEVQTCFEAQRAAGVVTGALMNHPSMSTRMGVNQGFDAFRYAAPRYPLAASETAHWLSWYPIMRSVVDPFLRPKRQVTSHYQPAETVLEQAKGFIQSHEDQPWSLVIHLAEGYQPYFEHPYLREGGGSARYNGDAHGAADGLPDDARASLLRALYRNEIAHADAELGSFMSWLRKRGEYPETLIVLTADYGESLGNRGQWWTKTSLFDEVVRVPLVVKMPGKKFANRRIPWQVRTLDACATALTAQGIGVPAGSQGTDLARELSRRTPFRRRKPTQCQLHEHPHDRLAISEVVVDGSPVRSVRRRGYKYVRAHHENRSGMPPFQFFDLLKDPTESDNLYGTSESRCETSVPELVEAYAEELEAARRRVPRTPDQLGAVTAP